MKTLFKTFAAASMMFGAMMLSQTANAQSCCAKKAAKATSEAKASCCASKAKADKGASCKDLTGSTKQIELLHTQIAELKTDIKASKLKTDPKMLEAEKCASGNEMCFEAMVKEVQALEKGLAMARNEKPAEFDLAQHQDDPVGYVMARVEAMRSKL